MSRLIEDRVVVLAPVKEVWEYYSNLNNLAEMMLPQLRMKVVKAETPLRLNSRIRFKLQPKGMPFPIYWDAQIVVFEEGVRFVDKQIKGPFSRWVHEHRFEPLGEDKTVVVDTLEMDGLSGLLASLGESFLLGSKLQLLFDHRRMILDRKFGVEKLS
ncbi:MAG: SRPBCC family protein [Candidatus Sumerlaeia bacterium]|nr:SRPBCC family protein [Candidatus Sumerlaeia bacterium]